MREIKFRYTFQHNETGRIASVIKNLDDEGPYLDHPSNKWVLLGRDQYTGAKGKNNKEIYEGDCFKTSNKHGYSSNCIGEVKFIEACFAVHIHREDLIQIIKPLHQYLEQYADSTEIIGTVHEIPVLLEKTSGD